MTERWVLNLHPDHGTFAAALRSFRGVEILVQPESILLRGPCDNGPIERTMWLLPGSRFHLTPGNKLIPWNSLLPIAECPSQGWHELSTYIQLMLPPAALPGQINRPAKLRLEPSSIERPAALLEIPLDVWAQYTNEAPSIRLQNLHFALSEESRVLVRGYPLPSLRGTRYTLEDGIAAACGMRWSPPVSAKVIADSLNLQPGEIALLAESACDIIPESAWVPASRSAVRISCEGLAS